MKKLLLILAMCLSTMFMTSCGETVLSTYYIKAGEASVNCSSNLFIKALIAKEIVDSSGESLYFFGEEDDAIAWFDQKCKGLTDPEFLGDTPILEDSWLDMELIKLSIESTVVKTNRLTFPASSN